MSVALKLAFIGGQGHHYLRGLITNPPAGTTVHVAAASDGYDEPAARRFAESAGIARWFDDGKALLDEFRPDIVSIGAVYAHNGDWVIDAINRGIAIVSDKPIAASWEQFHRLTALVGEQKVNLLTEFDFRARQEFRAARDAVRQGLIGDVVLATGQKSYRFGTRPAWYADRTEYGGTLMWVASHAIDSIPFVTGLQIERISGHGGNISRPDYGAMEDHVAAVMVLSGGATACVHADFCRPKTAPTHGDDRLRVAGSQGVIEIRGGRCKLMTNDEPEIDITERAPPLAVHNALYRAVVNARDGIADELYSTALSMQIAETLLRGRDSVDRSEWVTITGK